MEARIERMVYEPSEDRLREWLRIGAINEPEMAQEVSNVLSTVDKLRGENTALRYENDRLNRRVDQKQKAKARRREQEKRDAAYGWAILAAAALLISIVGNVFGKLIFVAFGIF